MSYDQQFIDAISQSGITPPSSIKADGEIHRFSSSGKRNDDSGWYVFYDDEIPAGAFGDWRTGVTQTWRANIGRSLTKSESAAQRKRIEAMQVQREAEREKRRNEARETATKLWNEAGQVNGHKYLASKGISGIGAKQLGDELLIPMRDSTKTIVSLQRILPDGTKLFLPGTSFGDGLYHAIGKLTDTIIICEGYATAASLHEATSFATVIAFNAGNLLKVAKMIRGRYPGHEIIIAADDDRWSQKNAGMTEAASAAQQVNGRLIKPIFIDTSSKPTDFNDLHQLEGLDAVRQCFTAGPEQVRAETLPTPTPQADVQAPVIFAGKPMQAAEMFKSSLPKGGRIIFWRGEFYSWDGSRYVVRDKVYIEQQLYHWSAKCDTWKVNLKTGDLEVVPFDPTAKKIGDFAHALRAVCYSDLPEPQCWIEQRSDDHPAGEIIAFRNGFLHWPTRTLIPSTDRLFVTSCLDFDYDEDSPDPTAWLAFLRALWPEDQQSIDALADMFGYLLTDDTSQQKMFMFIGPPRSGKGTILRVLESLIGYSNRVSPSLASIGTQFGLQPLIGKRVAMISDARLSGRADQQPIVEHMLRISGEDSLSIDRKNISAWTGKLPTRFVLASNELPAFSDASAALANRFILFKFTQSFLGREDMSLTSKLLTELPSIVLWALDGLERLKARGYLLRPESANDLAEDLIEQTSPIRSFVADKCVLHEDATCAKDELYNEWKSWCEDQGRDHPGTKVHFFRQLSAAFPSISRAQPRVSGTRLNLCQGIRIRGTFESGYGDEVKYF